MADVTVAEVGAKRSAGPLVTDDVTAPAEKKRKWIAPVWAAYVGECLDIPGVLDLIDGYFMGAAETIVYGVPRRRFALYTSRTLEWLQNRVERHDNMEEVSDDVEVSFVENDDSAVRLSASPHYAYQRCPEGRIGLSRRLFAFFDHDVLHIKSCPAVAHLYIPLGQFQPGVPSTAPEFDNWDGSDAFVRPLQRGSNRNTRSIVTQTTDGRTAGQTIVLNSISQTVPIASLNFIEWRAGASKPRCSFCCNSWNATPRLTTDPPCFSCHRTWQAFY